MNKRRALSRIEVLVIILVVLMAVVGGPALMMVSMTRVRKQARGFACLNKLKQWGLFFAMYAEDHDGRFMEGHTAQPQANRWIYALGEYYKWDDEFTCCPNATKPWVDENGVNEGAEGTEIGVNMAWGYMNQAHWKKPMKGSYGINGWCVNPPPVGVPHPEWGTPEYFWRGPNVEGAAFVPLFLEAQRYNGLPLHTDRPPSYSGEGWTVTAHMGRYCLNRHDGFAGCLFLDYSARKVGLKELWTLKWHKGCNEAGPWTKDGGVKRSDWPKWMRGFKDY